MSEPKEVYEYAGFQYEVSKGEEHYNGIGLTPVPGQHSAAAKPKHIRAAREQYLEDHR